VDGVVDTAVDVAGDVVSNTVSGTIQAATGGLLGRKLQQDNYGDQYDPYGVDTDDDYYSGGDGYFYLYPSAAVDGVVDTAVDVAGDVVSNVASGTIQAATGGLLNGFGRKLQQDNYGDWYDPYGVDTDDDYYSDGTGTFYLYADSGYTPEAPEPIGGIPPCYYTNTCEDNPSQNSDDSASLLDEAERIVDEVIASQNSDDSASLLDWAERTVDEVIGRRLQQDNYGDWYDPYGVDTDDDYYSDGTGTFYLYPSVAVDGVADTAVDVAGNAVSSTVPRSAIDTATGGLGMRKLLQDTSRHDFSGSLQHVNDNQIAAMGISLGSDSSYSVPSTWSLGDSGGWTEWTEWSNWGSWWG